MPSHYAIGLDFGTNSVRALIVDVAEGRQLSSFTWPYTYGKAGVIEDPNVPDLARQHPADYLAGIEAAVKQALEFAADGVARRVHQDALLVGGEDHRTCSRFNRTTSRPGPSRCIITIPFTASAAAHGRMA